MPDGPAADVTRLLHAWSEGDADALSALLPLVYAELRRLAHHYMRGERPGHPLQTTALVHEAYLRLAGPTSLRFESRNQFLAICARLMRQVLVDVAREQGSQKRGGGVRHIPFDERDVADQRQAAGLIALDDALSALAQLDERQAHVVELRYFGGLTVAETAAVLKVSEDTVTRDWNVARLWLSRQLRRTSIGPLGPG
jgi:RNA polymerase sigma factor (TIGR02999 family)